MAFYHLYVDKAVQISLTLWFMIYAVQLYSLNQRL